MVLLSAPHRLLRILLIPPFAFFLSDSPAVASAGRLSLFFQNSSQSSTTHFRFHRPPFPCFSLPASDFFFVSFSFSIPFPTFSPLVLPDGVRLGIEVANLSRANILVKIAE